MLQNTQVSSKKLPVSLTSFKNILISFHDTVSGTLAPSGTFATVTLNRPEIRNAFNEELIDEMTTAFKILAGLNEIRMVILTGAQPVFSAGGDLNWMKRSATLSLEDNLKDTQNLSNLFSLLNTFPKPLVGRIFGAAIGGGVGLTAVCDIVYCTQETQFSLSEVKLGLVPACIGPFVVAKIGASHARSLFISAERFGAQKALSIGLVHEVYPDLAALDAKLSELIGRMMLCSPNAVVHAKQLVLNLSWPEKRSEVKDPLFYVSKMLAELRVSAEGQEGLKAFLEKRDPKW